MILFVSFVAPEVHNVILKFTLHVHNCRHSIKCIKLRSCKTLKVKLARVVPKISAGTFVSAQTSLLCVYRILITFGVCVGHARRRIRHARAPRNLTRAKFELNYVTSST